MAATTRNRTPTLVQVFALWYATGPDEPEVAGVDVFFFKDDLKIGSISTFREPFAAEREAFLP